MENIKRSERLVIIETIIKFTISYFGLLTVIAFLIIGNVSCKSANKDTITTEQPSEPTQDIVDKPGDCVNHPLKGTWTAVVEGVNDTFVFNEDCTYTRTFSNEEGYIDKAKDHVVTAPNTITHRGETFLDEHFFTTKGSTVAENGWEQLEDAERGRPIAYGYQPHRIGQLSYFDSQNNLRNTPVFDLYVKSAAMPQATAYMVYTFTKIN